MFVTKQTYVRAVAEGRCSKLCVRSDEPSCSARVPRRLAVSIANRSREELGPLSHPTTSHTLWLSGTGARRARGSVVHVLGQQLKNRGEVVNNVSMPGDSGPNLT